MPIKIKRSQKKLIALTLSERAKPHFLRLVKKFIKDEVVSVIKSGRSPVEKGGVNPKNSGGKVRYKEYSDSYIKKMGKGKYSDKRRTPRNLVLTGKMLNSIKAKITKDKVRVWFTDEKAKYHDKLGAGKSKVIRRMLPKTGERFNARIRKKLVNSLANAIKLSKK